MSDARRDSQQLHDRFAARGALWLGYASMAVLVGGFCTWALGARISGAVIVPGQIEVEHRAQVVQHPEGGVLTDILVRDGSAVTAGQVLLRLDGTLLQSELAVVENQLHELQARRDRLQAERSGAATLVFSAELVNARAARPGLETVLQGQRDLFASRRETRQQGGTVLQAQSRQVELQIEGVEAQTTALELQAGLIARELADQTALLDKGLAPVSRVMALEREAAAIAGRLGELGSLRAQALARRHEIATLALQRSAETREAAEAELREVQHRLTDLAERRRMLLERIARLEITAPASGIVHALATTTPRAVLRPAEPAMYLVPQDRPLQVAARIPAVSIDHVRTGQEVRMRIAGQRDAPELNGSIMRLSPDLLPDPAAGLPHYRAEIEIPAPQRPGDDTAMLLPGMPVEVFIQTGAYRPAAYLLEPLTRYFRRALRQ